MEFAQQFAQHRADLLFLTVVGFVSVYLEQVHLLTALVGGSAFFAS